MRETEEASILKAQQCVELMQQKMHVQIAEPTTAATAADNTTVASASATASSLLGFNKLLENLAASTEGYNRCKESQEKLYAAFLNAAAMEQQKQFQIGRLYDYTTLPNPVNVNMNLSQSAISNPFLSPSASSTSSSGNQSPTLSINSISHGISNNNLSKMAPLLTSSPNNTLSFLASNSSFFTKQHKERKRRRIIGNLDNTLDGLVAKRTETDPNQKRYRTEKEAIELPDDETEMKRMAADPDVSTRMCSVCGYQGKWVSEMIRHKRVHTSERPFRCKYCNRTSKWKADLIRHVAKTHGIRVVSKYSRSKAFEGNVDGSKPVQDEFQHQQDTDFNEVNENMDTEEKNLNLATPKEKLNGNSIFRCLLCFFEQESLESLVSHLHKVHNVLPFECLACKSSFNELKEAGLHCANRQFERLGCSPLTIKVNFSSIQDQCNSTALLPSSLSVESSPVFFRNKEMSASPISVLTTGSNNNNFYTQTFTTSPNKASTASSSAAVPGDVSTMLELDVSCDSILAASATSSSSAASVAQSSNSYTRMFNGSNCLASEITSEKELNNNKENNEDCIVVDDEQTDLQQDSQVSINNSVEKQLSCNLFSVLKTIETSAIQSPETIEDEVEIASKYSLNDKQMAKMAVNLQTLFAQQETISPSTSMALLLQQQQQQKQQQQYQNQQQQQLSREQLASLLSMALGPSRSTPTLPNQMNVVPPTLNAASTVGFPILGAPFNASANGLSFLQKMSMSNPLLTLGLYSQLFDLGNMSANQRKEC